MQILLREAESTVSGNIPVAKGIDYFSRQAASSTLLPTPPQPAPAPAPPRRKFLTSLSPRKQSELRRRQSKRASVHHQDSAAAAVSGSSSQDANNSNNKKTPRSYKRISRPIFSLPMPAATANLTELLAAYLADTSAATLPSLSSPSSSSTLSSPATPRSRFSPHCYAQCEGEGEGPELDLLEPSPSRAPKSYGILGGSPIKEPVRNISGIFEVLDDASPAGFHP